nr:flagellin [Aureimonas sp. Leaf454]
MSVDKINITASNFTALSTTDQSAVLSAYIKVVNDSITKVTSAAASLGSVAKRVELQQTFVDTLMDTIDKGVGNLIDADLSEESTRLQALQTKQQLGVQALSIANSGTQQILRLFQ